MDTCLVVNLVSGWVGCVRERERVGQNNKTRESNNSWVHACAGFIFLPARGSNVNGSSVDVGVVGAKELFCFGDRCVCGGTNMRKFELFDVVEGFVWVGYWCVRNRLLYYTRFDCSIFDSLFLLPIINKI